jgi:hypothetical protein
MVFVLVFYDFRAKKQTRVTYAIPNIGITQIFLEETYGDLCKEHFFISEQILQ